MLTRVLLHVVEASFPSYGTGDADRIAGQRGLQYVCDAIAFVDDVGDTRAGQRAEIVRLTTRSWIECRLVEIDSTAVIGDVHNAGVEAREVGIRVVETSRAHGVRWRSPLNMSPGRPMPPPVLQRALPSLDHSRERPPES